MLTWIMFLKFLDDLELQREDEAQLSGKKFKPAIEPPYRWRDWAAKSDGITGDELIAFINNEETTRPDGKKGAGLFRYLRTLTSSNGDDRREVIATVFKGVQNRMVSGYLLRDVINKLNGIHFPQGRKNYTKTAPIQFEEFAPVVLGGTSARKPTRPGKSPLRSCSPPPATSTARTRAPKKTSPTYRPTSSPAASCKRSSASPK
jgi:hypothetical protein